MEFSVLKNRWVGFFLLIFLIPLKSFSQDVSEMQKVEPEFSATEKGINFSTVYGTQWIFYLISQKKEIESYGSFENWFQHPFEPHYDKDNFNYNLVKHTWVGQYYYLFYRSRGYTEQSSFIWSSISSLAFEFTIETVTEPPSYQDIYQTPVFGTILGFGMERLSKYFHSRETWYGTALGYATNPFTLLPSTKSLFLTGYYKDNEARAIVSWEF